MVSTWELTYIEESLEKSDNVSVQPFDLKEDEGGFSLEIGEIAGCLWCFTEDDLLVTYVRSPHTPEEPHRCEISKASRPSTIEAALRVILHRDQQGLERLQGFLAMRQRKGLLKTTSPTGWPPKKGPTKDPATWSNRGNVCAAYLTLPLLVLPIRLRSGSLIIQMRNETKVFDL